MAGPPHVVIVGGGFGGLHCVKSLCKGPVRITIIDRRNHHLFQPLLYQVATAALSPGDIAAPIRKVFRRRENVSVVLGEVTSMDLTEQELTLRDGAEIAYDYLVLATGATHSYFGHDDWKSHAPGLKTIEDALEIRRRLLEAFERAERAHDDEARAPWLNFVVVGGGPTGVELAGAFAEIARHTLAKDFRHFDPASARVLLAEGLPRVLPSFSEKSSERAQHRLRKLGVDVRTGQTVTDIDSDGVSIGSERIPAKTVIWAAGVQASPLGVALGVEVDRAGRVKVEPDLTVPNHREVFVIGDLAAISQEGKPVPGVAPAAIQMGRYAAGNIRRQIDGKPTQPFQFRDKGMLAAIGRNSAVADLPRARFAGFVAWVLWLAIHIFYLIGFRNRWFVMAKWSWAYVTWEREARLITYRRSGS